MYRVGWLPVALNELADIWTRADSESRQAITEATNMVDVALTESPFNFGESRGTQDDRILFAFPLGVSYHVDNVNRDVRILHVWDIRRAK